MLPKRWWKRKTTWLVICGISVSLLKEWGFYINVHIPFADTILWGCLFLGLATLRDGVEYNKVKAKRKLFNQLHNIPD